MSEPLLRIDGLSMSFGGVHALQGIDLKIAEGEVFGLLGPNGAGKTTLFNLIAGALRPTRGKITYQNRDITGLKPNRRAKLGIARTFQITQPFHELSVEENVMVGTLTRHSSIAAMREEAAPYVEKVGLAEKRHALAKELSTGQRKRLELARALATRPRLLLLDEVTGGVDHASIRGLVDLVASLTETGVTMIVVEHNMRVIMELAERIMFLNLGQKLVEGTPEEVSNHPDVVGLYLGAEPAPGEDDAHA